MGTQDGTHKKDLRVKGNPVKGGCSVYTLQVFPLAPCLAHHYSTVSGSRVQGLSSSVAGDDRVQALLDRANASLSLRVSEVQIPPVLGPQVKTGKYPQALQNSI